MLETLNFTDYSPSSKKPNQIELNLAKWKQKIETKFQVDIEEAENFDFYEKSRFHLIEKQWEEVYLKDQRSFTLGFLEQSSEQDLVEMVFMYWMVLAKKMLGSGKKEKVFGKLGILEGRGERKGLKKDGRGERWDAEKFPKHGAMLERLKFHLKKDVLANEDDQVFTFKKVPTPEVQREKNIVPLVEKVNRKEYSERNFIKCDLVKRFFYSNKTGQHNNDRIRQNDSKVKKIKKFETFFNQKKENVDATNSQKFEKRFYNPEMKNSRAIKTQGTRKFKIDSIKEFLRY